MSDSDESGQTVTLPETDWESILAVLQESALRERRHNHAGTADESKRLFDTIYE
jgi:hypothetical protein